MGTDGQAPLDLIREITNKCGKGRWIFRGENKDYGSISSKIFRDYNDEDIFSDHYLPVDVEEEIVGLARQEHYNSDTPNIEILTELRHFGGATTLIDFSTNLHVALFFACNGEMEDDGRVIAICPGTQHEVSHISYSDSRSRQNLSLIKPARTPLSRARVEFQSSIFVYAPKGVMDISEADGAAFTIPIPAQTKQDCLDYLRHFHGVSALTIYNDLIGFIANEENLKSARLHFYRGNANYQSGKFEAAITDYDEALKMKHDLAAVWYNRGLAQAKLGKFDAAIADCSRAIELKPDHAAAWNNRGLAQADLGKFDAAIADYSRAIELKPDYADAWVNRGLAQADLGKFEAAITDYDEALKMKHNLAAVWYNRGVAQAKLGKFDAAIADYSRALELKPDFAAAWNNRGVVQADLGEFDVAIADYSKAIELKPDYADAWANRGVALAKLGKLDAAIADYSRALELKPDYAAAWYNRGWAQAGLGEFDVAIADYSKAIELKPDYADAWANRGVAQAKLGEFDAAIADFEQALELARQQGDEVIVSRLERLIADLRN